jgi:hypothetical protein
VETRPFDPAEYLDSEEAISAYLADARQDGAEALSRAAEVVARARRQLSSVGEHRRNVRATAALLNAKRPAAVIGGVFAMSQGKTTGSKAASAAGKTLASGSTGSKSKSAAGSALSQRETKSTKDTSGKAATSASKTLSDGRTSKASKSAAGSALSQKKS